MAIEAAVSQSTEAWDMRVPATGISVTDQSNVLEMRMRGDNYPIFIRLLGGFQLVKAGHPITVRGGGKTEALLCILALRNNHPAPRAMLLDRLWSDSDPDLASQSMHSLVYSLNKLLGDALCGNPVVVYADGGYRLNHEAGVGTDIACFEELTSAGDQRAARCDAAGAAALYRRALLLYGGDLCDQDDMYAVLKREHLRAGYLSLLAHLADFSFSEGDYTACLAYALRILSSDPCREDAHRIVMRCYVRRGERAQALRQYRLCESILGAEFETAPEPATKALFDQVRDDPGSI